MSNAKPTPDVPQTIGDPQARWQEEETLILDSRAELTPSQMVEQRLINMLRSSPLLVSHVQRQLKPGPR